jgi:ATP/maltotriose-dependent transcriptional regulator MalT
VPLARAQGSSGDLEASLVTLREVLSLLPPELGAVRGQTIAFTALIQRLLGRHGESRATLENALRELPDDRSAEAAILQVELGADHFLLGEWEGAAEWAQRALALSSALGVPDVRAASASLVALARYQQGRVGEAREQAGVAREIIDRLDDSELATRIDAPFSLGGAELLIERYEDAIRHLERCISISRATGQGHMLAPATVDLAIVAIFQGRLDEAARRADEALEIAHLSGSDQLMEWAQTTRAWAALKRGDLGEAIAAGQEAVRIGGEVTAGAFSVGGSCWLADAMVESGDPAGGRGLLLEAIGRAEFANVDPGYRAAAYEVLTRAELALGDTAAADAWTRRAADAVEGLDLARPELLVLRAQAAVALAGGDQQRAAELALRAAEIGESVHGVEAARARALAGRALVGLGERERGIAELERARAELEQCGARRYLDQTVRELRRLGRTVGRGGRRGRGDSGVEALSGRELEVAELVTQRLTNREIAERLVLSEKTIERHLSRIFQKLGVSSRVEVAREIERSTTAAPLG